jgi:proteasome lid subunit RPN8/RPN11
MEDSQRFNEDRKNNMTPSFLTDKVKSEIAAFCHLTPDKESCGLVLNDGTVIRSENKVEGSGLAEFSNNELVELTQETGAMLDMDLYLEHEDSIACFWHSHCSEFVSGWLSFTDTDQSRFHEVPYLLYHTKFDTWDYFDPNYYHPYPLLEKGNPKNIDYYLSWPFVYGRSDCGTLLRSYYYNIYGVRLPDFPRINNLQWYRDSEHESFYIDIFESHQDQFFKLINTTTPKKGDVVLLRFFGSRQPCHVGIMVEDDKMLHLLEPETFSEVVIWGGIWKRGLHSVWRLP